MKEPIVGLLCWAALALTASAGDLAAFYAPSGQLILTGLASAPFPHPNRAEGHQYKDQFYPAKEHYSDNTVALFIPKSFRETGRIDLVVHFHGWRNHVEGVLRQYQLIEQLVKSERNAVLVVPQGPRDAPDSFGGKLEDPDGFKRFIGEVAKTLRQKCDLKRKDFSIGSLVLSGHSGGYQVISSILDHGGLAGQVKEVWLFDALYAQTDKFLAWHDQQHGRLLNIYTEHGGTKAETEQLMATLKRRGTPFLACKEAGLKAADLRTHDLVFLYSELAHDDVLDKHRTFREFLTASGLGKR
ncbi:MAG TPA: hypothetical protein VN578_08635 [Candidatus Binatia bacterium]|jgi:hypothetical protein|nr:hypothetical protein [Candidatus Binatia bacterium]